MVLASKVRDVRVCGSQTLEFQRLVTNFKDEGGSCDDLRTAVVAATAACPGECGQQRASLNACRQSPQQFAKDLVFAIKSPVALDT